MNESTWTEPPAAEDTSPELLHEVRALLNEFQELAPSVAGYAEAVAALRVARDTMAAAVTASGPVYDDEDIRDDGEQWADEDEGR